MKTVCTCLSPLASDKLWATVSGIDIVECSNCGVRRVREVNPSYTEMYTSGDYHAKGSEDLTHEAAGRQPHKTRLEQDRAVAESRIERLNAVRGLKLPAYKGELLDVGCANGAFMLVAGERGYNVEGVDLSADAVVPELKSKVRVGSLRELGFQRRTKHVVTFNDSFEHFINPLEGLLAAKGILRRDGILVIDIPDMGSPMAIEQGVDFHHVKPHEHIWYFTSGQIRTLLENNGFYILHMEIPVPGKITVYATPDATVQDINIYGPPGIGDILWTLCKLRRIRETEWPCRIIYNVCVAGQTKMERRAEDFLKLCELVDEVRFEDIPCPFTDYGCADPSRAEYELVANGWVDTKEPPYIAKLLENWHPELETDWDIGIEVPKSAETQARMRTRGFDKYAAIYMSSVLYNNMAAEPDWTVTHWITLMQDLKALGLRSVILGAEWDRDMVQVLSEKIIELGMKPSDLFTDLTGKTPIALAMAFMKGAEITIGIAAGLPIIAAQFGWPTIILWPVHGISGAKVCRKIEHGYNLGFCTSWIPSNTEVAYLPVILGPAEKGGTQERFRDCFVQLLGVSYEA